MSAITASASEQPEPDAAFAAEFSRSDVNHLLETREPTRSRDVAVGIDDTARESSDDQA